MVPFSSVYKHVFLQMVALYKCFLTYLTFMIPFSRVNKHVFLQMAGLYECFLTYLAFMIPFSSMYKHVLFQSSGLCKCFLTNLTFMFPFNSGFMQVLLQCARTGECIWHGYNVYVGNAYKLASSFKTVVVFNKEQVYSIVCPGLMITLEKRPEKKIG